MSHIRWVIPGKLGRSSVPDLQELYRWQEEGISSVVNLLAEEHLRDVLTSERSLGFNVLHVPVSDFGSPSLDQLTTAVLWIDNEIDADRKVVVHCYAGIGRTGTVLIAYLIHAGATFGQAHERVMAAGAAPQALSQQMLLRHFSEYVARYEREN